MADQVPAQTPATPAQSPAQAAAASPAVQQRFAQDNDLLRLNVYGREQVIPVSEVKRDAQTYLAGKQALEQAKQLREETRTDQEHARRWRDIEMRLRMNPQATLKELERLAGVHHNAQEGLPQEIEQSRPVPDPNTRALEDRIAQLESRTNQTLLEQQMRQTLDTFPLFTQDEKARRVAEKQILAALVVDRNADLSQVAREVHSELFDLRSGNATAVRDQRAELARTPNIPANLGVPDLADIPQGTAKSLEDGSFLKNFRAAASRFAGQVSGNGTA